MPLTYEEKHLDTPHRITLDARSQLSVSGVTDIESFDENAVVLETSRGVLVIHGRGLHLQTLSLDGGQVAVDGTVDSLVYEEDAAAGGWLSRLFR